MIVYNKEWLDNRRIRTEAGKALKAGLISAEEMKKVEARYPDGFFSPNIFVRVGLFLLTIVILLFSCGLVSLILSDAHVIESPGYIIFLGLSVYGTLLFFIKQKHHLRSGVDDALMWTSGGLFVSSLFLFDNSPSAFLIAGFVFLLSALYVLQFGDVLIAALNLGALICFAYFGWKTLPWGMAVMPFFVMLLAGGIFAAARMLTVQRIALNYLNCLYMVQVLSLVVLYLAGNYYVVQALNDPEAMFIGKPAPLPFSLFFWAWTVLVPFVYVYAGLKKKDVLLLRTGLLLIAGAALTFRNYYHVMPIEAALCIIGMLLLAAAYASIKYLNHPKHGFTYEDLGDDRMIDKMRIESLIVAETFADAPVPGEPGKFGGGSFGGGGASSDF